MILTSFHVDSIKGHLTYFASIITDSESQQFSLLIIITIIIIKTKQEQMGGLAKASRYSNRPVNVQYNL